MLRCPPCQPWFPFLIAVAGWVSAAHAAEPRQPWVGDPFPLQRCVMTGEAIEAGDPVIRESGREIRFCCGDCKADYFGRTLRVQRRIKERIVERQLPRYPLEKCLVSGKPLGDNAVNFVYRNRLFRLCCPDCREKIRKDPASFFSKLDRAVVRKQRPTYPLEHSVVSGEPLGEDAVDHVIANRLVRLAGRDEVDKLERSPGEYLAKLRKAPKEKTPQP